jgi:hypothetical protein
LDGGVRSFIPMVAIWRAIQNKTTNSYVIEIITRSSLREWQPRWPHRETKRALSFIGR